MSDGSLPTPDASMPPARVPLFELFVVFLKIGTLAVGGGSQAFMYRDLVEEKRWIDDKAFLTGLAIRRYCRAPTR